MSGIIYLIQFFFAVVIGLYFLNLLRKQTGSKAATEKSFKKEMDKLNMMKSISLTIPLSEKIRPKSFEDIIGQEDGIKALKAALCSPNPQHVLIYGPPGVGKTAAARLVLDEAKRAKNSPFNYYSKFVEMDATTIRFDERSIADPLMGSVHDPIYQGAGPLGQNGIPQPKPGAVTKAHGGILFLDEIGELHPVQLNKLLKVLEDRKVNFDSAYYNPEDDKIPPYIHEVFNSGLPADFRLVGATTKSATEIPPAIRSRCIEIYFRTLLPEEIGIICKNAGQKSGFELEEEGIALIKKYASNGREAINLVQIAGGVVSNEKKKVITRKDIEWVIESGKYQARPEYKVNGAAQVGVVNGLAVTGTDIGVVSEVEAITIPTKERGRVKITGIAQEEEISTPGRKLKRKSTAQGSIDNVLVVLKNQFNINVDEYDIHLNFPGGMLVDGPSAGITMATAIYSAITKEKIDGYLAMTGEITIRGIVKPVGGVCAKIQAAQLAGCKKIIIPWENWQERFEDMDIQVIRVKNINEVIKHSIGKEKAPEVQGSSSPFKIALAKGSEDTINTI